MFTFTFQPRCRYCSFFEDDDCDGTHHTRYARIVSHTILSIDSFVRLLSHFINKYLYLKCNAVILRLFCSLLGELCMWYDVCVLKKMHILKISYTLFRSLDVWWWCSLRVVTMVLLSQLILVLIYLNIHTTNSVFFMWSFLEMVNMFTSISSLYLLFFNSLMSYHWA